MRRIGILGGMGPQASADIYLRLIRLANDYRKDNMEAYPHIMINSIPWPILFRLKGRQIGEYLYKKTCPSPNLFRLKSRQISEYLCKEALRLEHSGAEVLALACNSVHYYFDDIRATLSKSIDFINMVDEVVNLLELNGISSIGLLSTSLAKPLYVRKCKPNNIKVNTLPKAQQQTLEDIILDILIGQADVTSKSTLQSLSLRLLNSGAECIVIGCTDLGLLLQKTEVDYRLYSSNEILAEAIFSHALNM